MWRGIFLGVSQALATKRGSQRSTILDVLFYLCVHHLTQNYQISCEEGLVLAGQLRLTPNGRVPALPNFGGSFYLCAHFLS